MSAPDASASAYAQPDEEGRFGEFGGSYVAETLVAALTELRAAYAHYKNDPSFQKNSGKRWPNMSDGQARLLLFAD